jgi:hypothetical protein
MTAVLSRIVMALAVYALGNPRREWARGMQVEFEVAQADGKPLAFAFGCLLAACRELPSHEAGRFAIASHVLALGFIVPIAAIKIASVLTGFPTSYLGHVGTHAVFGPDSGHAPLLNEGTLFAIPALGLLVLLLAALNLRIAWLALERDWAQLARAGALGAAATATLLIFSAIAFFDHVAAFTQAAVLTLELTGAWALARWHAELSVAPPRRRSAD